MRKQDDIRIVLGNKRYAGASNQPVQIQLPLKGDSRNFIQGDRTTLVDLQDIFEKERQKSTTFRIAGKIVNIFNNSVSGRTNYSPFKNSLYYINPQESISTGVWQGYPPYQEFEFIRESMIENHVPFISKSSTTYNWSIYTSYAFSSTTAQTMSYTSEKFNVTNTNFQVHEGIPFVIDTGTFNGKDLVYFYCATSHNLTPGQYVKLNITINNKNVFQVYDVGDGTYGTEKNVFSIYDLKFDPNDIITGTYGNFKRIITLANSGESESRYYIRLHKILSSQDETFLTKMAFENNPFPVEKKLEYSALTPNNVQRVSVKDGRQSYGFTINKDLSVENLIDNNGKPITEFFITIINKGYGGWFNKPALNSSSAIDIGWKFNFTKDVNNQWWKHNSSVNKDNIPFNTYQIGGQGFFYNQTPNIGDMVKGDFCEYNNIEQKEYVLSDIHHKYSFNTNLFSSSQLNQNVVTIVGGFGGGINLNFGNLFNDPEIPEGYIYKPHYSVPIRVFSDYIESTGLEQVSDAPFYSYYSNETQQFIWRDLYTYGYIDSDGIGINHPFINGAHYPFKEIIFLQYPIARSSNGMVGDITIINQPTNDNCE
jgi:hypothetical protein